MDEVVDLDFMYPMMLLPAFPRMMWMLEQVGQFNRQRLATNSG